MNDNLRRILYEVPWGMWVFLIVQGSAILVWGVRVDGRIGVIEQAALDIRIGVRNIEADHRVLQSKVIVIEERQNRVIETNNYQQRQIDYIIQWFSPHITPPGPIPPVPRQNRLENSK